MFFPVLHQALDTIAKESALPAPADNADGAEAEAEAEPPKDCTSGHDDKDDWSLRERWGEAEEFELADRVKLRRERKLKGPGARERCCGCARF